MATAGASATLLHTGSPVLLSLTCCFQMLCVYSRWLPSKKVSKPGLLLAGLGAAVHNQTMSGVRSSGQLVCLDYPDTVMVSCLHHWTAHLVSPTPFCGLKSKWLKCFTSASTGCQLCICHCPWVNDILVLTYGILYRDQSVSWHRSSAILGTSRLFTTQMHRL